MKLIHSFVIYYLILGFFPGLLFSLYYLGKSGKDSFNDFVLSFAVSWACWIWILSRVVTFSFKNLINNEQKILS